jgi:hypothetical protein
VSHGEEGNSWAVSDLLNASVAHSAIGCCSKPDRRQQASAKALGHPPEPGVGAQVLDPTFGYWPVLLETFFQTDRHRGTCYLAANWVHLGQTVGRGKKAPTHKQILPLKEVWIYPLRRDYLSMLTASSRRQRSPGISSSTGSPNIYELGGANTQRAD